MMWFVSFPAFFLLAVNLSGLTETNFLESVLLALCDV